MTGLIRLEDLQTSWFRAACTPDKITHVCGRDFSDSGYSADTVVDTQVHLQAGHFDYIIGLYASIDETVRNPWWDDAQETNLRESAYMRFLRVNRTTEVFDSIGLSKIIPTGSELVTRATAWYELLYTRDGLYKLESEIWVKRPEEKIVDENDHLLNFDDIMWKADYVGPNPAGCNTLADIMFQYNCAIRNQSNY